MPLIQIIIDDSTSKIITGTYEFDRTNGGTLMVPSGSAFPGTPAAKELFWRTDEAKLYRRADDNLTWVALISAVAAHASTHNAGGSDALAIDAAAGTGSLRTLGTAATAACAGNDARLSDARTPSAHSTSHKNGGSDEVATATAAANAIPKAGAGGTLAIGWLPTGSTNATVCIGDDSRLSNARTPTSHASTHNAGGGDALAIDAAAGTGSLRTLGTAATAACAGNDARLSDDRTASGLRTATSVVAVSSADAPTSGQVLTATAGNAASWQTPASGGVFGQNYQSASSEGTSTTTNSTMQDKVTLTTPALTGVYRLNFFCEVTPDTANKRVQCRLYNVTDAVEMCFDDYRPALASLFKATSGFGDVTFTGAAKTFKVQFASQDNSTTVDIRRARIEIWRET